MSVELDGVHQAASLGTPVELLSLHTWPGMSELNGVTRLVYVDVYPSKQLGATVSTAP